MIWQLNKNGEIFLAHFNLTRSNIARPQSSSAKSSLSDYTSVDSSLVHTSTAYFVYIGTECLMAWSTVIRQLARPNQAQLI